MSSNRDLFTAFREGSEQLRVEPSQQAWQRLESRMVAQPKPSAKIVSIRRLMALAATLVLLIGVFFVNKNVGGKSFAVANEPSPSKLEDLVNTDGCNPFCLVLKERNELPGYYANPVRK